MLSSGAASRREANGRLRVHCAPRVFVGVVVAVRADGRGRDRRCTIGRGELAEQRLAEDGEGLVDLDVAIDAVEQALAAEFADALVEPAAKAAEAGIVAVAEGEHGEADTGKRRARCRLEDVGEAHGGIGRIALAVGAGDHGEVAEPGEHIDVERLDVDGPGRASLGLGRLGELLGEALGRSGLRGVDDGERRLRSAASGAAAGPGTAKPARKPSSQARWTGLNGAPPGSSTRFMRGSTTIRRPPWSWPPGRRSRAGG